MSSKICLASVIVGLFAVGIATAPTATAAPADDACSLLTTAQVSAALGASVGAGSYVSPALKTTCTWTATGQAGYVTLMIEGLDAYKAGKSAPTTMIVVTPVRGIGDDAYYLAVGKNVGLIVKKGNVSFKVAVYSGGSIDKKKAMEKTLASQAVTKL